MKSGVTKFRDFLEKQDGSRNPNVTFKLSEIRNAIELIRDDHSVVAEFAKRFVSLCQGAQALWAHDYRAAMNAFLVAFDFELPVGNWYMAWVEIRARHFVFTQLRQCTDFEEEHAVTVLRILRDKLKNAVKNGSSSVAMKQFTKLGNMVASTAGTASIDHPETLPLGILDTMQDVIMASRRGNVGAECLEIIEFILTTKSSTKLLRYKALEVMYVIRDHPGTSTDVGKQIDGISARFEIFIRERIETETERQKNAQLKKDVLAKLEEDMRLRRLISSNVLDKKTKPDPVLEELAEINQTLKTLRENVQVPDRRPKILKNLFKNLSKKQEKQEDHADADAAEPMNRGEANSTVEPQSFEGQTMPKIKPRVAGMECGHSFNNAKTISIMDWQRGSILCEECKAATKLDVWLAAKLGDIVGLKHFLDGEADVNATSDDSGTLLSNVIAWCPEPVAAMNLLIERGAKIDSTHTISPGKYLTAEELLQHSPIDRTQGDLLGATLLHLASISHKPVDIIGVLLKHGADISATDNCNQTALFYFLRFCTAPLRPVVILVNRGCPLNTQSTLRQRTPLIMAARYCDDQCTLVRFLVNAGANAQLADELSWNLLHYLCYQLRSLKALTFVLDRCGININALTGDSSSSCIHLVLKYCANPIEPLKIILRHAPNLNQQDNDGWSCFHHAANRDVDTLAVFEILHKAGANPALLENTGCTALHFVCRISESKNTIEAIKWLIAKGLDINLGDKWGNAPMHYVAWFSSDPLPAFQIFVEAGAEPRGRVAGDTALHCVLTNKTKNTVVHAMQYLIDAGWLVGTRGNSNQTPLLTNGAISINQDTIPKYKVLLENGADIKSLSSDNRNILHIILTSPTNKEYLEPMKFVIEMGAEVNGVNVEGFSPVHHAAGNGADPIGLLKVLKDAGANFAPSDCKDHNEHALFLIEKGVPINHTDITKWTPLHYNAYYMAFPAQGFELLLAHGADVNAISDVGETALHILAENENCIDLSVPAKIILDAGVNIEARNESGFTALHALAYTDNDPVDSIKALLEKGADAAATTQSGATSLHLLLNNYTTGSLETIPQLIEAGCPVDSKDENGFTPLLYAANVQADPLPIIKLLLEHGADPNVANSKGVTALALLICNHRITTNTLEVIPELINAGCAVDAKSSDGYTPLLYAASVMADPLPTMKLLLEHGADVAAKTATGHTIHHTLTYNNGIADKVDVIEHFEEVLGIPYNPNIMDRDGTTPAHCACCNNDDTKIIEWMLAHGADLTLIWKNVEYSETNYNGGRDGLADTALRGKTKLMEYLLERRIGNPHLAIFALNWKKAVSMKKAAKAAEEAAKAAEEATKEAAKATDATEKATITEEDNISETTTATEENETPDEKASTEEEIRSIDELIAKLAAAAEAWGPKSEAETELDAAPRVTAPVVKEETTTETMSEKTMEEVINIDGTPVNTTETTVIMTETTVTTTETELIMTTEMIIVVSIVVAIRVYTVLWATLFDHYEHASMLVSDIRRHQSLARNSVAKKKIEQSQKRKQIRYVLSSRHPSPSIHLHIPRTQQHILKPNHDLIQFGPRQI
ncbi:ankyrin repeat-containing domain protein [Jimgerdemannia flammicorona]|uniref:Ankyrin repeat-containing domain protein n=1 Tax=Jimgerdemannia flammicorona TaxID=994334 RepID=A0A433QKC5_9FUNG|nr:ankyrin repeat-containing domain protein [Jimgerdemannia flammicorona]